MTRFHIPLLLLPLAVVACSSSEPDFLGDPANLDGVPDNVPVVDYSLWPLASVTSSLGDCATWSGTPDDYLWVPTLTQAETDGYGYMSHQISLLLSTDSPPSTDCEPLFDRVDALASALHVASRKEATSDAFAQWSECMELGGFPSLDDPSRRGTALAQMLYNTEQQEPVEVVADRAEELRERERAMAMVDVACQAQTIATVAEMMIADEQAAINEAPSDQAALLRG